MEYYHYLGKDLDVIPCFRKIHDILAIKSNEIIFDAGCGVGYVLDWLRRKSNCIAVGFDCSSTGIKLAKMNYPQCNFVLGDIHAIPFKNDVFNKILCINVLEHLRETQDAIQEIKRVSKVNGVSIFGTIDRNLAPIRRLIRILFYLLGKKYSISDPTHVHEFTVNEFTELLAHNGKIEKVVRSNCSARFGRYINNVISKLLPCIILVKVRNHKD